MATEPAAVLIVEDDALLGYSLVRVLTGAGLKAVHVEDAEAALRRLEDFDIIVSDVKLQDRGPSGLDVLRAAKDRDPGIEVIMVTGFGTMELAVDCLRAGAADLLSKPFDHRLLVASVQRALERQRLSGMAALVKETAPLFLVDKLESLPTRLLACARQGLRADAVSVLVPADDGRLTAYVAASDGRATKILATPGGVAERVARLGEPMLLHGDLRNDPRFSDLPIRRHVRSSIVYPLKTGAELSGVLTFNRTREGSRPFCARDLDRAATLASQTRLALQSLKVAQRSATMERLAAMGELVAGVAHEINNPVSFVRANLGFIRDSLRDLAPLAERLTAGDAPGALEEWARRGTGPLLKDLQDAASEALEGADRVAQLVTDMRGIARKEDPVLEPVALEALIQRSIRLAGGELKAVQLHVDVPSGLTVDVAPGRMVQVFINLLVNAAQALEQGDRSQVHVRARREDRWVLIEVQDTGTGIPEHVGARVFDPFFTTKRPGKGTGLGLSISREIVERHGGTLRFTSRAGLGTTFEVRLPVAPAGGTEAETAAEPEAKA